VMAIIRKAREIDPLEWRLVSGQSTEDAHGCSS
jgi:hypothetical protein